MNIPFFQLVGTVHESHNYLFSGFAPSNSVSSLTMTAYLMTFNSLRSKFFKMSRRNPAPIYSGKY